MAQWILVGNKAYNVDNFATVEDSRSPKDAQPTNGSAWRVTVEFINNMPAKTFDGAEGAQFLRGWKDLKDPQLPNPFSNA